MFSTLDIFPCDLGEPLLVPGAEDFEADSESADYSALGKRSPPFQDQEAEEWADIT